MVAATGPADRYLVPLIRRVFKDYEGQLEWIDLVGLSVEELLPRVSRLPESTAILYLNVQQDDTGGTFVSPEVQQLVSKSAKAPLHSLFDTALGCESVCGRVTDLEATGKKTGENACGFNRLCCPRCQDAGDERIGPAGGTSTAGSPPADCLHHGARDYSEERAGDEARGSGLPAEVL